MKKTSERDWWLRQCRELAGGAFDQDKADAAYRAGRNPVEAAKGMSTGIAAQLLEHRQARAC